MFWGKKEKIVELEGIIESTVWSELLREYLAYTNLTGSAASEGWFKFKDKLLKIYQEEVRSRYYNDIALFSYILGVLSFFSQDSLKSPRYLSKAKFSFAQECKARGRAAAETYFISQRHRPTIASSLTKSLDLTLLKSAFEEISNSKAYRVSKVYRYRASDLRDIIEEKLSLKRTNY